MAEVEKRKYPRIIDIASDLRTGLFGNEKKNMNSLTFNWDITDFCKRFLLLGLFSGFQTETLTRFYLQNSWTIRPHLYCDII